VDLEGEVLVGGEVAQLLERLEETGDRQLRRVRIEEERGEVRAVANELDRLLAEEPAQLRLRAQALREAEEVERALGQAGVRPAPERFVGRGRASRDPHDGLEGDRDAAVPEQLLELARAGKRSRSLGSAAERDGGGRVVGFGRLRLRRQGGSAHSELEIAEVDDVPLADRAVLHGLPVHEGPVRAVEVADAEVAAVLVDLGVDLRDRLGSEHKLQARPSADPERKRMKGDHTDAAVVGGALEMPGGTGAPARWWRRGILSHAPLQLLGPSGLQAKGIAALPFRQQPTPV
jgi:hypothetical protein